MKKCIISFLSVLFTLVVFGQQDSVDQQKLLQGYTDEIEKILQIVSFQTKEERSQSDKIIASIKSGSAKDLKSLFQKLDNYYVYEAYKDVEYEHTLTSPENCTAVFFEILQKNLGNFNVTDVLVENFKRVGGAYNPFEVKARIKVWFEGNNKSGFAYVFLSCDFEIRYMRIDFSEFDYPK